MRAHQDVERVAISRRFISAACKAPQLLNLVSLISASALNAIILLCSSSAAS